MNKNTIIKYTPFILILLNFILKLIFLTSTSIGGDEPFSIYHAQMDVASIIKYLTEGNNPPLYEILLHYWIKLFGISELSVRLPSVIFSALTVYYIYKIGYKFFSYEIGLVAGLIFSFSNLNLLLAHEARTYAFFVFFTAVSLFYFLNLIKESKKYKYLFILLFANIMLVYLHYFGFFVIAVETLCVLFINEIRKQILKIYLLYILLLIICYLPNIHVFISRFLISSKNGTWVAPPTGIASLYGMLRAFSNQPLTTVFCVLTLIATFVAFVIKKEFKLNSYSKVILLSFVFPFTFMFLVSFWVPMFLDRYLVFVTIGYYLTMAFAIFSIFSEIKYSYILSGVIVVLFVVTFNPNKDNSRHVRETVAKIVELKNDSTTVIICPTYFTLNFSYYYNKAIFSDVDTAVIYNKMNKNLNRENIYPLNSLTDFKLTTQKVIYLDAAADFSFPNNNIYNTINSNYKLINTYKYFEIFNVFEFERK